MATQVVASVTCPNCRTPFTAPIEQIIDAQTDLEAKTRLVSGQLNAVICPHCGFQGALNTPFLYHDAELELALVYMPMALGASDVQQQKAIGDLTNRLMQQLPPEARKGYLLQPRVFFSVQGLVDALLERDEATRQLVEAQRRRLELFERLHQIDPNDSLAMAEYVGANDRDLDEAFFQLLDIMISVADSRGETAELARLSAHQAYLLEKSSTGRLFKAQQLAVEALTTTPTRETLVEQLIATDERAVRETLVLVGRQMLDYAFFQALTARIDVAEAAGDKATQDRLHILRKEVQEIRDQIDALAAATLDARARLLRDLLVADNPQEMMTRHLLEIDDAFLGVLASNIRQAANSGRSDVVQKLRSMGDMAIALLNEHAPPEIKLINRLVAAESDDQVRQMLEKEREHLDQDVLELVERTAQDLERSKRKEGAERLRYAAEQMRAMIAP